MQLTDRLVIRGEIYCVTGLRIGGSQDQIEIGAVDNPVIKHPLTGEPYIPGSSLKGKVRSRLEMAQGLKNAQGNPCGCAEQNCLVCRMFGPHMKSKHDLGPSRILFRDCGLTGESRDRFSEARKAGANPIEIKTENMINRTTGVALHPRPVERVPAGFDFDMEIVLQLLDLDKGRGEQMLAFLQQGLQLVQEHYLGAGGSRGHGQIEFRDLTVNGDPWPLYPAAGEVAAARE
jgi:CRISPR-associated protein Csm3